MTRKDYEKLAKGIAYGYHLVRGTLYQRVGILSAESENGLIEIRDMYAREIGKQLKLDNPNSKLDTFMDAVRKAM